jgi:hypothetical protein
VSLTGRAKQPPIGQADQMAGSSPPIMKAS